jgi:hypothetical protein
MTLLCSSIWERNAYILCESKKYVCNYILGQYIALLNLYLKNYSEKKSSYLRNNVCSANLYVLGKLTLNYIFCLQKFLQGGISL